MPPNHSWYEIQPRLPTPGHHGHQTRRHGILPEKLQPWQLQHSCSPESCTKVIGSILDTWHLTPVLLSFRPFLDTFPTFTSDSVAWCCKPPRGYKQLWINLTHLWIKSCQEHAVWKSFCQNYKMAMKTERERESDKKTCRETFGTKLGRDLSGSVLKETIFHALDDDCSGEVSYIEFCHSKLNWRKFDIPRAMLSLKVW